MEVVEWVVEVSKDLSASFLGHYPQQGKAAAAIEQSTVGFKLSRNQRGMYLYP